ncbi:MAG TPA: response regulator [Acidimicrobiales bacterium]|nr:response regulator [Acidimicrobiales bacterium]
MGTLLIATDADSVAAVVDAALADDKTAIIRVHEGRDVLDAAHDHEDDLELVILDLQIGNMGGMAVCMALRHEEGADRLDQVPVLMLLDRSPDVFLAKRSGADGWLIKPLDAVRLRRASDALRRGESYTEHADVVTVPAVAAD